MVGKKRRMERLFRGPQGRCLMTPLDHAPWLGPLPGIDKPQEIVRKVLAGGANALLITPGFLQQVSSEVRPETGICLRVSIVAGPSVEAVQETPAATVRTALRLDADAVAVSVFFGRGKECDVVRYMGELIEECSVYDLPVVAEMMPAFDKFYDVEAIAHVARLGMELGADVVKTNYCGDPQAFKHVVDSVCVPIIIAGGENNNGDEGTLAMIRDILEAGAAGVAIGRRVWQSEDPQALVAKMRDVMFAE